MSLDEAILHGKEKRKPYRGVKNHFSSCRNHGACDYCKENRLYGRRKREERAKLLLKEFLKENISEQE